MITATDLQGFLPNLVLLGGIVLTLLWDLLARRSFGSALGAVALGAAAVLGTVALDHSAVTLFSGLLTIDLLSKISTVLFCATSMGVLLLGGRGAEPTEPRRHEAEWVILVLLATVAMSILASAVDLLSLFLGLETLSLCSYLMVALGHRRRAASEAALKYVLYGGVSSGVMLYGMSLLYGLSGASRLAMIGAHIVHAPVLGTLAIVLCLAGFGYKIAAAPFHAWAPDVYDGAPAPVAAFLSVGPKAAGVIALYRFVALAAPSTFDDGNPTPWSLLWPLVAVLTMTVGNLAALGQHRVQRMLAYSGIAQIGYILAALAMGPRGGGAMLLYVLAYAVTNLGAFAIVCCVDRMGVGAGLLDWRGLVQRMPWLAVAMACFLFSLVGLPPFAGFFAKWSVLSAILAPTSVPSPLASLNGPLAFAIVLNSVVSLAYYGRLLRVMFFEAPTDDKHSPIGTGRWLVVGSCAVLTVGFAWLTSELSETTNEAARVASHAPAAATNTIRLPSLR